MPTCFVCQSKIDADQEAFEYHVSKHFDQDGDMGEDAGMDDGPWGADEVWEGDHSQGEWEQLGGGSQGRRLRGGSSRGPARPADRGEKQVDSSHSAQPLPRMGGSDLLRVLEPPSTSEHRGLRKKLSAMLLGSPSRKGKEREVDGYDEGAGESSLRGGSRGALMGLLIRRSKPKATSCPICALDMDDFTVDERSDHVTAHLDEEDDKGASPLPSSFATSSTSPKGPSSDFHRDRRDLSWSPVASPVSSLPHNMTPGLIPVLHSLLLSSAPTRSAILCRPLGTTHVASVYRYDNLWGCGYRNFQMTLSALLGAGAYANVEGLMGEKIGQSGVGIATLQSWIEDAWSEGWDAIGKKQLKNRVKGQKKWIGSGDVWVGLMSRGIRCHLVDFPKTNPKAAYPSHVLLQRWVVNYFNSEPESSQGASKSAFDLVMQSRGESVRMSDKYPLILQHHGHSRTIIGCETTKSGDTNLLLFDPAKTIPSALRRHAIKEFDFARDLAAVVATSSSSSALSASDPPSKVPSPSTAHPSQPPPPIDLTDDEDDEADADAEKKGNKRMGGIFAPTRDAKKKAKLGSPEAEADKKEKMGTLRERYTGDVGDALKVFRVNLKTLKRNAEYQILSFTGERLMSQAERERYKVVVSTTISH